jgi:hypothetical protein
VAGLLIFLDLAFRILKNNALDPLRVERSLHGRKEIRTHLAQLVLHVWDVV